MSDQPTAEVLGTEGVDYDRLDREQEQAREALITEQLAVLQSTLTGGLEARLIGLQNIPDLDWAAAEAAATEGEVSPAGKEIAIQWIAATRIAGGQWHTLVEDMTPVQKLVHLAMRMTDDDRDRMQTQLVRARRRAYEDELTAQAARVGCSHRRGHLSNGRILKALGAQSREDATGIVATYNRDLAYAIRMIAAENPRANRNVYAARLRQWEAQRNTWKLPQIQRHTDTTARARAQQDFVDNNQVNGKARLAPARAVCPVCQGWLNRGAVPMKEAMRFPPPYHPGCPHFFQTYPKTPYSCGELWMGEG